jgi:multiple sugar transport system ATP-binding protein
LISGLEDITSGTLSFDGQPVNRLSPSKRGIAMVFQSYALYPHMSVYKNLAFGLETAGYKKAEIQPKVKRAAEILQIEKLLERKPKALSGGQRQRVAIGRAIVREPRIFLFDEPLSNLDAELRVQMRVEISRLHRSLGNTMIYVTHDQVEAMTMADKIVVLNRGNIEQVGSPLELYRSPRNLFVAGFIGSPKMNFIKGQNAAQMSAHTIGIRPEHVLLSTESGDWKGRVTVAEHLGSDTFLHVDVEDIGMVTARSNGDFASKAGDTVYLTPDKTRIHKFNESGLAI